MTIGCMRTDGEGESVPIHNRKILHAFPSFREAHVVPAALRSRKSGLNEPLAFVDGPFITQRIRQLGEHCAQDLLLTPLLASAMHRLIVGIALRQAVSLRARIQNPKHSSKTARVGIASAPAGSPEYALQESAAESAPSDRRTGEACPSL